MNQVVGEQYLLPSRVRQEVLGNLTRKSGRNGKGLPSTLILSALSRIQCVVVRRRSSLRPGPSGVSVVTCVSCVTHFRFPFSSLWTPTRSQLLGLTLTTGL